MKQNLRILKLNLEIERLRSNLEESRIRNLKLEMKTQKLFDKIKTLNTIQINMDISKKWGKEFNDLETIMEESDLFNDSSSEKEIKHLFMNLSREINETQHGKDTVQELTPIIPTQSQLPDHEKTKLEQIISKLSTLDKTLFTDAKSDDIDKFHNPLDLTEYLIQSFESKLSSLKESLHQNIKSKSN